VFSGNARWVEARASGDGRGGHLTAPHEADTSNPNAPHERVSQGPLHPHDPAWVMTVPLVVLGVCSVLGGLINLPFHPTLVFLERWLDPVVSRSLFNHHFSGATQVVFACVDAALALLGVGLAVALWRSAVERPEVEPTFLQRAWYIDFGYDRLIARTSTMFAAFMSAVVESRIIDGAVNGIASAFRSSGGVLRKVQTGYVRNYALGVMAGLVVLLAYVVSRSVS
jgi:NADH-quinone oxidoreductase subunit L